MAQGKQEGSAQSSFAEFGEDTVRIDPMDLNREFSELPPRVAYWNAQLADATHAATVAKYEYETERARQLLDVHEAERLNKAKWTVAEVDAKVDLHEDVQDAHSIYVQKEAERLRVRGIVDALLVKKDMLQSLGAKLRIEMMADPVLRDQIAAASAMEFGHRRE